MLLNYNFRGFSVCTFIDFSTLIADGAAINTPLMNTSFSITGVFNGAADTNPCITEVTDIVSGKANSVLTKGGIVQLAGSCLKFDQKDEKQGIFFIPESGAEVRAEIIAENKPARLMAIIPASLAAGNYYVEVRTKILRASKKLKTLKIGRFDKLLVV